MSAYYNEHDPFAAAWLRELIADGLIAPGEVDERSIEDVRPSDLAGFVQCHFFAGIGIWSLALREAGWPDDAPVWTGSCPCQPFSAAGKGGGFADERHLWPAFHWLIEQCGPELVLGEQVASKDGLAWLDLVSADVEASGYAFGAADTCAAGFGAPHIRQRLYWMADAAGSRHERAIAGAEGNPRNEARLRVPGEERGLGLVADASREQRGQRRAGETGERSGEVERPSRLREAGRLADADDARLEGRIAERECAGERASGAGSVVRGVGDTGCSARERDAGSLSGTEAGEHGARIAVDGRLPVGLGDAGSGMGARPGPLNGLWRDADWLFAPGTFPLAPGGTVRNRVGQLRGAGNAINLAQAAGFIEAVIEVRAALAARLAA